MTEITMKHLRYFKTLTQNRHFGKAAEACSISQPALSLQIKELEEILGAQLVERGARRITITPLGQDVARRCEAILRAADDLVAHAHTAADTLKGQLRLGVIPTIAPYRLPAYMTVIRKHYPQLDLRPREALTQKLLEDLRVSRLDAAILALPIKDKSLKAVELFEEEFMLVRPLSQSKAPVPNAAMPAHKVGRLWKFKTDEVDDWVRHGKASDDQKEGEAAEADSQKGANAGGEKADG